MPQDRDSGAAGNQYGRKCGERVAVALGAQRTRSDGNSNECILDGLHIVIKCSRFASQQQVGVYCKMLARLDAVVGAFENRDGSYDVLRLPAKDYADSMRVKSYLSGDLGLVHRRAFTEKGVLVMNLAHLNISSDAVSPPCRQNPPVATTEDKHQGERIQEILAKVKPLAAEYYQLTGKPLGVTGEVAEEVAARILGLTLVPARTVGYDALRGTERIQIKGRAYGKKAKPGQRMSRIKLGAPCDTVLLVLLDNATLEAREMWEAPYPSVCECLSEPGSKARARGALSVSSFKGIATRIWKAEEP
jgi:hypothetical protein